MLRFAKLCNEKIAMPKVPYDYYILTSIRSIITIIMMKKRVYTVEGVVVRAFDVVNKSINLLNQMKHELDCCYDSAVLIFRILQAPKN